MFTWVCLQTRAKAVRTLVNSRWAIVLGQTWLVFDTNPCWNPNYISLRCFNNRSRNVGLSVLAKMCRQTDERPDRQMDRQTRILRSAELRKNIIAGFYLSFISVSDIERYTPEILHIIHSCHKYKLFKSNIQIKYLSNQLRLNQF